MGNTPQLPPELLLHVFVHLEWPYDLPAVALASRECYTWATIALASTLPIPFVPEAQDRLVPWLQRLLEPSSKRLRLAATRIVLDDIVKPIEPTIPLPPELDGGLVSRSRITDDDLPVRGAPVPHRMHFLLQALLPQLSNITALFIRRPISWFLLDALPPHISTHKRAGSKLSAFSKFIPRRRSQDDKNDWMLDDDNVSSTPTYTEHEPRDVWSLLLGQKPYLHELFLCCMSSLKTPDPSMARNLTTVMLHDLDCRRVASSGNTPWTPLLFACQDTLRHLCLVRVLGFATLVAYTPPPPVDPALPPAPPSAHLYFSALCNFEAYKMVLHDRDSVALADFLNRHSPSLRVLALGIRCATPAIVPVPPVPLVNASWLENSELLSNLRIFRLENSEFIAAWTEGILGPAPTEEDVVLERRRRLAVRLAEFVIARPSIMDVTFPDLAENDLAVSRLHKREGRVLLGNARLASFQGHVPAEAPAHHRRYLWSAWVFYELLFKDLVLEHSGFRPPLSVNTLHPDSTPQAMEALASSNTRVPMRVTRMRAA